MVEIKIGSKNDNKANNDQLIGSDGNEKKHYLHGNEFPSFQKIFR